jgi:predicted NUDIX family NTP pyrophosphohydrolase
MGDPFWVRKDAGAWTIPKGEFESEPPLEAARGEFLEEIAFAPQGNLHAMQPVQRPGGTTVYAFALEWDYNATQIKSNSFEMEWPKGSRVMQSFPKFDRPAWFTVGKAKVKIFKRVASIVRRTGKDFQGLRGLLSRRCNWLAFLRA